MPPREIAKKPPVPPLNATITSLLTELCFRQDNEGEADALFAFGTRTSLDAQTQVISNLLLKCRYPAIVLSGGIPDYEGVVHDSRTEAELLSRNLAAFTPEDTALFLEKTSTNTLDNVRRSHELYNLTKYKRIIFVAKSFVAGRCYLTLKKHLPNNIILQKTYDANYHEENVTITKYDWHDSKTGRERIWGEFLRIKHYGQRGDIEISPMIKEIESYIPKEQLPC